MLLGNSGLVAPLHAYASSEFGSTHLLPFLIVYLKRICDVFRHLCVLIPCALLLCLVYLSKWLIRNFECGSCTASALLDCSHLGCASFPWFCCGVRPLPVLVYNPRENGLVERWNRTLKGGIQAFTVMERPWEEGMTNLLAHHWHMPSSPQGQLPASLLLGRRTRMSFELPVGTISTLTRTMSNTDPMQKDWSRLRPLFHPGELVLVHAGPIPKGATPYKGPLKVEEVLGCYIFVISDGQCWSTCCMKQWYEPPPTTCLELVTGEQKEPLIL